MDYQNPSVRLTRLDMEGLICLSATVTVDELDNKNAGTSATEPYLDDTIEF